MAKYKLKLTLLLFTTSLTFAQELSYNYGIIINTKYTALKKSLKKQLKNYLEKIKEHELSREEREYMLKIYLASENRIQEKKLEELRDEKSREFFTSNFNEIEREKNIEREIESITESLKENKGETLKEKIDNLISIKTKFIDLEETSSAPMKIDFNYLETNNLFLVISLDIEEIEYKYYQTTLKLISHNKKEVFTSLIKSNENLSLEIINFTKKYSYEYLIGSKWAGLEINVVNENDARIILNNTLITGSRYNNDFLKIKDSSVNLNLKVQSSNYKPFEQVLILKEREKFKLDINLERANKEEILIKSNIEANVFINGILQGKTPLKIEKPEKSIIILLSQEGYKEKLEVIYNNLSEVFIKLEPNNKKRLIEARDYFYNSLTFTTLSVFATLFSYAISYNISASITEEPSTSFALSKFFTNSGIILSISSFINLIISLKNYINEAERGI